MNNKNITMWIIVVTSVIILGFIGFNASGNDDSRSDQHEIPVNQSSEYKYDSIASINDSYTIGGFDVSTKNNTYIIKRIDDVPNSGHSLEVDKAHVVGNTLVIEETFVDTTDKNVATTSVISTDSYKKSWELVDIEIDTIAVENPYNEKPYIKKI